MTKIQALQIIADNQKAENRSFLYYLHEEDVFNEGAFWTFYNAVRTVGYYSSRDKTLDRELTSSVIQSYGYFLRCIGFHFDENDSYKMKHRPDHFMLYCSRLSEVILAFVQGRVIDDDTEKSLNSDLENRYMLKLNQR